MMARAIPSGSPTDWARFISTVGVTSIVTLGGGYWVANYVIENQNKGLERITIVSDENKRIETKLDLAIEQAKRNDEEFLFYARQVCALLSELHGSKSNECVPPRPGERSLK